MRIRSTVCQLLVSLACVGVALPQVVYAFDGPAPPLAPATAAVLDIALDGQGSLHGQASDSNGQALALSEICLRQQGQVLAQTKTDKSGLFTFPGVRAGLYEIRSGDTSQVYRVWTAQTHPPSARDKALLVNRSDVVRGKGGGGGGGNWNQFLLVSGLVIAAGVIGGVIGYNLKDDDDNS